MLKRTTHPWEFWQYSADFFRKFWVGQKWHVFIRDDYEAKKKVTHISERIHNINRHPVSSPLTQPSSIVLNGKLKLEVMILFPHVSGFGPRNGWKWDPILRPRPARLGCLAYATNQKSTILSFALSSCDLHVWQCSIKLLCIILLRVFFWQSQLDVI